jgi:type IV secretion system protein VirB6
VLDHIDCQAATLGSFGFQALAQPGGLGQAVLTGLLTLMIAILALRLMMGRRPLRAMRSASRCGSASR